MESVDPQGLIGAAKKAAKHAYAPYSRFKVGAAILTNSGGVYSGCNVENASYGLTICAERAAVFNAVAAGDNRLEIIAVVSENGSTPCGACRQVLAEFNPDLRIILGNPESVGFSEMSLSDLLPEPFGPVIKKD
jgi:cytidine deaminase